MNPISRGNEACSACESQDVKGRTIVSAMIRFGDQCGVFFLKSNLSWITCARINIIILRTESLLYSSSNYVVNQQQEAVLPRFIHVIV